MIPSAAPSTSNYARDTIPVIFQQSIEASKGSRAPSPNPNPRCVVTLSENCVILLLNYKCT